MNEDELEVITGTIWAAFDDMVCQRVIPEDFFLPTCFTRVAVRIWTGLLYHTDYYKDEEFSALLVGVELIDRELERVYRCESTMRPLVLNQQTIVLLQHALEVCDSLNVAATRREWLKYDKLAFEIMKNKINDIRNFFNSDFYEKQQTELKAA